MPDKRPFLPLRTGEFTAALLFSAAVPFALIGTTPVSIAEMQRHNMTVEQCAHQAEQGVLPQTCYELGYTSLQGIPSAVEVRQLTQTTDSLNRERRITATVAASALYGATCIFLAVTECLVDRRRYVYMDGKWYDFDPEET